MPSQAERHAWHRFREEMASHQAAYDGHVPIVLVCLPVCTDPRHEHVPGPGEMDVDWHGAIRTMKVPGPSDVGLSELLERAAAYYRARGL